jgi:NADH-quinone oxidoreductase subunit M
MGPLLLLLMVFLPLAAAVVVFFIGSGNVGLVKRISLGATIVTFALSVIICLKYTPSNMTEKGTPGRAMATADEPFKPDPQFTTNESWLTFFPGADGKPKVEIRFHMGVDGLSLWLVALTALLMIPSVLISWDSITERQAGFYALLLVLESGMLGVFCAFDIILFYVFFEFTLLPLFFLIGIWGGPQKRYAARKFFIYTLAGSLLGLVALVGLILARSELDNGVVSFSIIDLVRNTFHNGRIEYGLQFWIFLGLFAGFAIKVPLFPFHTWLPLAHVEAPTAGSVLLAGVLLKLGTYGFLRLCLPLLPDACVHVGIPLVCTLSIIGIIYGALCALAQDDIKKLVAYSSVSHLGFCMLGLFALNAEGITGSVLQMINHGLSTGMLFLIVGMVYERYHSRSLKEMGGLASKLKLIGFFMVFAAMSSAGLPGLNGFVGEFLCLAGIWKVNPIYTVLASIGVLLGAWYLLTMLQKAFFGPLKEPGQPPAPEEDDHGHDDHAHDSHASHEAHGSHGHGTISDMTFREGCILVPLAVCCLWIGLYPKPFIDVMKPEATALGQRLEKPLLERPASTSVLAAPVGGKR